MDMMFDLSYSVSGEDEPFKMKFNEVIFVMEDVDCASKALCGPPNTVFLL